MITIETEQDGSLGEGTADTVRSLFAEDATFGGYIILIRADDDFIQAEEVWDTELAGLAGGEDGLVLEYHDPMSDGHFRAKKPIEKPDALARLLAWIDGSSSWKRDLEFVEVAL
jgi:hypothetical protein